MAEQLGDEEIATEVNKENRPMLKSKGLLFLFVLLLVGQSFSLVASLLTHSSKYSLFNTTDTLTPRM